MASAAIRLSQQDLGAWLPLVRGTHRASASLATVLILAVSGLAWRAGRRALAASVLVLTIALSILGAATGISPPPAAQAGNLLGGLALAALLARLAFPAAKLWAWIVLLLAIQVCIGAWLSIFSEAVWSLPLLLHAVLGIGLSVALAVIALKMRRLRERLSLVMLALAVPAAGAAAALLGVPLASALIHAALVAGLVVAAASLRIV